MRYTMEQLDNMEGHLFENAVADLLFHNGYRDVSVTQGSGDYGIDILARRKNKKYAIQCKRYKTKVSVKAVQEAGLGADFYHCDAAAVITNNEFTKPAENLAKTTGVRLWGRDFLRNLIDNYDDEYDTLDPENAMKFIKNKELNMPATKVPQNMSPNKTSGRQNANYNKAAADSDSKSVTSAIIIAFILLVLIYLGIKMIL